MTDYQLKILRAAAHAKNALQEGLQELREWEDEGYVKPKTAHFMRLKAANHLQELSGYGDAFDLSEAVNSVVDSYELHEHVGPDPDSDPVALIMHQNRSKILMDG